MTIADATVANSQYELIKIILDFISSIIWPLIALFVLMAFKKEIKALINRATKVELPGGVSLDTIQQDIQHAKTLADKIDTERKPEVAKLIEEAGPKFDTDINSKMTEIGLQKSPSGLDLSYYKKIAETDPQLALAGLRFDLEIILKNYAKGLNVPVKEDEPVISIVYKLFSTGSLSLTQYQFIMTLYRISNAALHGANITYEQALEVLGIGDVLVKDYKAWFYWLFENKKRGDYHEKDSFRNS